MADYRSYFEIVPGKRGGKPCFKGTRLTPYDVLGLLAGGVSKREILRDYPYLTSKHLQACLAFAADDHGLANLLETR
jgi:uncharacterized protein (DUF433 family)